MLRCVEMILDDDFSEKLTCFPWSSFTLLSLPQAASLNCQRSGVAPGICRQGADSSDEGAKIWFSGYYQC